MTEPQLQPFISYAQACMREIAALHSLLFFFNFIFLATSHHIRSDSVPISNVQQVIAWNLELGIQYDRNEKKRRKIKNIFFAVHLPRHIQKTKQHHQALYTLLLIENPFLVPYPQLLCHWETRQKRRKKKFIPNNTKTYMQTRPTTRKKIISNHDLHTQDRFFMQMNA